MKTTVRVPEEPAKNLALIACLLLTASLALTVSSSRCAQEPATPPAETFAVGDAGPPEPPPDDPDSRPSPTIPLPPPSPTECS